MSATAGNSTKKADVSAFLLGRLALKLSRETE